MPGNPGHLRALTRLFAAVLACLSLSCAMAQAAENDRWSALTTTIFQHYRQDDAPATATALAQDRAGFLWVGSQSGLLRWDGYRFRVYRRNIADPHALPDVYIQKLFVDRRGQLWIGTSNAGVARYDAALDRFVRYPVGGEHGLPNPSVLAFAEDGDDGLLVGTSTGLHRLDLRSGTFSSLPSDAGLPSVAIQSLLRDRGGALWIATRDGLARQRGQGTQAWSGLRFDAISLPLAPDQRQDAESLMEDDAGRLWIGTSSHGAFVRAADGGTIAAVLESGPQPTLQSEDVYTMAQSQPGEVWLGTWGQGIVVVDTETLRTRRIRNDRALAGSLGNDTIWSLLRDRSGLMWVGAVRGLSHTDPRQGALRNILGGGTRPGGLSDPEVTVALAARDGKVWLGLGANGIDIVSNTGTIQRLRADPARPDNALPGEHVISIAEGPDIYAGTLRGLYRIGQDGVQVERLRLPGRAADASADALLWAGDALWMGAWDDGLWELRFQDGVQSVHHYPLGDRLADHRILILEKGVGDTLWIGTGNGLTSFDRRSHVTETILPDAADPGALAAGYISSLCLDRRGRLWVASTGGGVSVLTGRDKAGRPRFHRIGAAHGLYNDVGQILQDGQGYLWASMDKGLARIDPDTFAVQVLRRAEGVALESYWSASGAVLPDGQLLFGGMGGATLLKPELLRGDSARPPVAVTDLRVGGQVLAPGAYAQGGAPLLIPPGDTSLAVEFSALDYSSPERNRYAYRLDGYDHDWIATDPSRRLAAYSNLAPGDYTLRLRGSNRDGTWSDNELRLPLRVLPAWRQTGWFKAAMALGGALLMIAVVEARTAWLRRQRRELERCVHERTAELEQATRELREASLTDPLTQLRNRRFLMQNIEADAALSLRHYRDRATQAEPDENIDLIFYLIDLDHFKQINDVHGHAAGDAVLIETGRRLKTVFRESDYVVRWGGEEFLCVGREMQRAQAAALAERIRAAVAEQPFALPDGPPLTITCSVGYACFPGPGEPCADGAIGWKDVVVLADMAMYIAKRGGRNAWAGLTTPRFTASLLEHARNDIEGVLARGELQLVSSAAQ